MVYSDDSTGQGRNSTLDVDCLCQVTTQGSVMLESRPKLHFKLFFK